MQTGRRARIYRGRPPAHSPEPARRRSVFRRPVWPSRPCVQIFLAVRPGFWRPATSFVDLLRIERSGRVLPGRRGAAAGFGPGRFVVRGHSGLLPGWKAQARRSEIGKMRTGNSQWPFHCGLASCRRADRRASPLSFCLGASQGRPAHDPCPLRPGIVGQQRHMKHGRLIVVTPGMCGGWPCGGLRFGLGIGHMVLQYHVLRYRTPVHGKFMANAKVPLGK